MDLEAETGEAHQTNNTELINIMALQADYNILYNVYQVV